MTVRAHEKDRKEALLTLQSDWEFTTGKPHLIYPKRITVIRG